jgi:hypothetical protein
MAICITIQSMLASCKVRIGRCHYLLLTFYFYRKRNCEHPDPPQISCPGLTIYRPEGNDDYVRTAPDNPKKVSMRRTGISWSYADYATRHASCIMVSCV